MRPEQKPRFENGWIWGVRQNCAAGARISPGSQHAAATSQIHLVKVTLSKYSSFLCSCGTVLHMETFTTSIAVCQIAASTSPCQDLAAELHRAPFARSVWVSAAQVALLILAGLLWKRNWKTTSVVKAVKQLIQAPRASRNAVGITAFCITKWAGISSPAEMRMA